MLAVVAYYSYMQEITSAVRGLVQQNSAGVYVNGGCVQV